MGGLARRRIVAAVAMNSGMARCRKCYQVLLEVLSSVTSEFPYANILRADIAGHPK